MNNNHVRRIEPRVKPVQAVITSTSRHSLPSLELTVDKGNDTRYVTTVAQRNPGDQFYTTATSKRSANTFGVNESEEVYAPHPVTDLEVNGFLNHVAKLLPPKSMETVRSRSTLSQLGRRVLDFFTARPQA